MGLFQKRPVTDAKPMYSLGLDITLLIVGLGNPGKEYDGTRHNIGFDVIETFAQKMEFENWINKKDQHSLQASLRIGSARVILCKPTTFMNESGRAVRAVQNFYKVDNAKTLVVYDELDINFGQIRTRFGGSNAGHNGIKSITNACGEDYGRVRIGIGPKIHAEMDTADFVLSKFPKEQVAEMPSLIQEANAILSEFCYGNGELRTETRHFII